MDLEVKCKGHKQDMDYFAHKCDLKRKVNFVKSEIKKCLVRRKKCSVKARMEKD